LLQSRYVQDFLSRVTNLSTPSLILNVFLAYLVFKIVWIPLRAFYRAYFHPLSHIPGPKGAVWGSFWSINWLIWPRRGTLVRQLDGWHDKYGKIRSLRLLQNLDLLG